MYISNDISLTYTKVHEIAILFKLIEMLSFLLICLFVFPQSLYDPFYLMFYNMAFTAFPILVYGLFEQHKPQEDLLGKPHLYK